MKRIILFMLFPLFSITCQTGKKITDRQDCTPISKNEFLQQPLHVDLTMNDFRDHYGKQYRERRFSRDLQGQKNASDTIYHFTRKNNSFIFYASGNGRNSFLTSKIRDDQIELRNCIRIGMKRSRLKELIIDFPAAPSDTLRLQNEQRQAVFIFTNSQLHEVHINDYYK